MDMICKLYSRHYNMQVLNVSPADMGHAGYARDRIYLILWLKGTVDQIMDPEVLYSAISHYIQRFVKTEPKDYLVSSQMDYFKEAERIAVRRKLRVRTLKVSQLYLIQQLFVICVCY